MVDINRLRLHVGRDMVGVRDRGAGEIRGPRTHRVAQDLDDRPASEHHHESNADGPSLPDVHSLNIPCGSSFVETRCAGRYLTGL